MKTSPFESPPCDDAPIRRLWLSVYVLPALNAADELGLFALLDRAPRALPQIAAELGVSARGAQALVATLAAADLLVARRGEFHLTELSRIYLVPGKPFYWGDMLRLYTHIAITHEGMMAALRRDEPSAINDGKVMTDGWGAAEVSPEQARSLTRAMHSMSAAAAAGLAHVVDLADVRHLLDVGGGSGCYSIAMALRHPETHFTVADLAPVCALAAQYVADARAEGRVDTFAFDMFRSAWPPGYDAVFFANVLHDWDKDRRLHLLRCAFEALPPGGRVFIYEMLLSDAEDGPLTAALFSVCMVLFSPGKQFTAGELAAELRACGFDEPSFEPAYAGYTLASARKPG
jgi:3-hydroxy-5-methyl-1-naphthoate 3-O-methyltransferase